MPPFLRHGRPIGQRVHLQHHVAYICRCHECSSRTAFDPITRTFGPGREFGKSDFQRHQRQIERHYADSSMSLADTQEIPQPMTSSPSSSSERRQPDDTPSEVLSDEIAVSLSALEAEISRRRDELQDLRGLIFLSPPNPLDTSTPPPLPFPSSPPGLDAASCSEINGGMYAVAYDRRVNQPVLEHLQWLQDITLQLDAMAIPSDMRDIRKKLLDQIEKEISRVEEMKAKEWHRQYKEQKGARNLVKQGVVTVVDTRNNISFRGWLFMLITRLQ